MKMSKEDFYKVWKDSGREEILNQYYYDRKELQARIDKAIKYINEHKHLSMFADCTEPEEDWIYDLEIPANELLDILKGEDKE